jgi:carbamoyltransferase
VDGSARAQTVDQDINQTYHALLREFEKLTGVPVLMNTSLNIRGEPSAMTPADAIRCFQHSDMDCLCIENFLLQKEDGTIPCPIKPIFFLPLGIGTVTMCHVQARAGDISGIF